MAQTGLCTPTAPAYWATLCSYLTYANTNTPSGTFSYTFSKAGNYEFRLFDSEYTVLATSPTVTVIAANGAQDVLDEQEDVLEDE